MQVDHDTVSTGPVVTGTVTDLLGGTATATVVVQYDGHGPTLAPIVTPPRCRSGRSPPTATPNATDASSGVASESCAVPQTTTAGAASVLCKATDVAGNRSTAPAYYTVQALADRRAAGWTIESRCLRWTQTARASSCASSGVPVLFRACDANGTPIGTKGFVTSVTLRLHGCAAGVRTGERGLVPADRRASPIRSRAQLWTGHIPTLKLASGKKYTYRVLLADGTSFTVTFGVR